MKRQLEAVAAFHEKLDVSAQQRLEEVPKNAMIDIEIMHCGMELVSMSKRLQDQLVKHPEDRRLLRAHLLIEELGEMLMALGERFEIEVLDGLADLLYVLVGAAVTMDLPLSEAFEEVHASNMTKEKRSDDKFKDRVRDKGPNYRGPNLLRVLQQHRKANNAKA